MEGDTGTGWHIHPVPAEREPVDNGGIIWLKGNKTYNESLWWDGWKNCI